MRVGVLLAQILVDALRRQPLAKTRLDLRAIRLGDTADGREPETALTGAILTAAQINETSDLIGWAANAPPSQLASLAPVVLSVADAGDLRANAIVSLAVEELVLHVRALARQLFGDERAALPIALSGGMLSRGTDAPQTTRAPLEVSGAGWSAQDGCRHSRARCSERRAPHPRRGDGVGEWLLASRP